MDKQDPMLPERSPEPEVSFPESPSSETQEFPDLISEIDLEDIIREFHEDPPSVTDATESSGVTGDTIRMDFSQLPKSVYSGASPLAEEPPVEPEAAEPDAEPFSDRWEPEYEQPMGEYTPPQPIIFQPKSRYRELKKKLVAGPEHRYYILSEKSMGKLQVLLFLATIVSLICMGATVLYHLNRIDQSKMKLMVFGQLLAMFLCALLGSGQLIEGLADLLRKRFSLNSMLLLSFVLCCLDGIWCLIEIRVPCCAAFTLQMVFSLFDSLHRHRTELSQMDVLRKATDLTAVRLSPEKLDGKKVLLRSEGQVEDFMSRYQERSSFSRIRSIYAMVATVAALGVGITGWILSNFSNGVHVAAITLLAASPATFFICFSRPADILQKRFHRLGTLLCGWSGIRAAQGSALFPVSHQDIFPAGSVKMNGVKFFGIRNPDEVVAYGSALVLSEENGLAPLFEQLLESRNCHRLSAQELQFHSGGISGEVRGEPVMVGTLNFMREMGIEIPEGARVSYGVYVAIDNALSGLFAISYEKTPRIAGSLNTLCAYRKLKAVIADGDFLLRPNLLRTKFSVNPDRMVFADPALRSALYQLQAEIQDQPVVLSTQQELPSLAYGISGARALYRSHILGLAVHLAGGLIGIAIMLTLTIIGATHLLSPMNVILYQLLWSIPGFLLTEWTRLI